MVADFDASARIRLYNNKLDFATFQYSFSHDFGASDIPGGMTTSDGWHKMKVEVQTIDESTTSFNCYFDGELLAGCPIIDDGGHQMDSGQYGLFSFQQGSPLNGYFDNFSKTDIVTDVEEKHLVSTSMPEGYALEQNYPNPFNPSTVINYSIPESGLVTLKVFNVLGQEVAELVNDVKSAGTYSASFDASELTTGIYVYTIHVDNYTDTKKMMLVK